MYGSVDPHDVAVDQLSEPGPVGEHPDEGQRGDRVATTQRDRRSNRRLAGLFAVSAGSGDHDLATMAVTHSSTQPGSHGSNVPGTGTQRTAEWSNQSKRRLREPPG